MNDKQSMLALAHDSLDTARNAFREIGLECELVDNLIQEVCSLRDNPDKVPDVPPYERPTGERLTFSPDTRDAIGYIQFKNNTRSHYGYAGIEAEFLNQINPNTAQTLHLKSGFRFLVAVKFGRTWNFLPPVESLGAAISALSNHHGKLRILIEYVK